MKCSTVLHRHIPVKRGGLLRGAGVERSHSRYRFWRMLAIVIFVLGAAVIQLRPVSAAATHAVANSGPGQIFLPIVNVSETAIECNPLGGSGSGIEEDMPGLLYATAEDRTLLRWYWSDCTTATFQVYRSENGGPETLIATVTPETDPVAATHVLNTTDLRWPNLATEALEYILEPDTFDQDSAQYDLVDLYNYLYTNGMAGLHLTNRYYPLALILGWGYVDSDITTGANYTYRVVAIESEGGPLQLGEVDLIAGQRTPLAAPSDVASGVLDVEVWDGHWGRYQRNRRYDGQIYLNWDTSSALNGAALTIGYDVFRASAVIDSGRVIEGQKSDAGENDAMIVPGPAQVTEDGVEYLFRFAPGDYQEHTYCVGPRDLLNHSIRWPQDAHQCSAPIVIAAQDFMPPAAPDPVWAEAVDNSEEVGIHWEHADPGDVAHFVIQRTTSMHCETGDCWVDIVTVPGHRLVYTDTDAGICRNDPLEPEGCWYRVAAMDSAGNRSMPSKAAYAIIHDTLPPTQLDIRPADCTDPAYADSNACINIASDAVSIRINCRFSLDGEEMFIAEVEPIDFMGLNLAARIQNIYAPPLHLQGVACRFILSDVYGNLSDINSSPVFVFDMESANPDQLAQPMVSQIETIFDGPGDWAATLHWEMAAHPMLDHFIIEREHGNSQQNFIVNDADARSYTDSDVVQGQRYTYRVRAVAAVGYINDTLSEPRSHRILPGEDRPLAALNWLQDPNWLIESVSTSLLVDATAVAEGGVIHFAVFRSLHPDRDFLQITPVLQVTGSSVFYTDNLAQRPCYYYAIVTFRTRDGEPTGYSEPRQAQACDQPEQIYTPGPIAEPPTYPYASCIPAELDLTYQGNLHFGGGFQVVLEGLNDNHTGPDSVSGGGWLLIETQEETIYAPMSFSGLTVNEEGHVCSGTALVDLSTMAGRGVSLQAPGGWRYLLREITLQPWFGDDNHALATLELATGAAFTNHNMVGRQATSIELAGVHLVNSLRFNFAHDFTPGDEHSCAMPSVAFRMETLPLDVIPTGMTYINELSIQAAGSCTQYVDRYNALSAPMVPSPYAALTPERFMNDGYLANPLTGGPITLTPAGLSGSFSSDSPVDWYAAYPFAFQVEVAGGMTLNIVENHISDGTLGGGTVRIIHHQTIEGSQQAIVEGTFAGLTIGNDGDLHGTVNLGGVDWDAFAIPGASWELYQGALTSSGLPAYHDTSGIAQSIMWQVHPTSNTPVAVPDGVLPGHLEPGFNRRATGATLAWANCGVDTVFSNVSMDAYLRRSGMTQQHIPIYAPDAAMTVHGYQFLPEQFDLHFMDNALLSSDIRGYVQLPFPSDIEVHLVDIWLTGNVNQLDGNENACIGGGRIPEGERDFVLDFWDVQTHFTEAEFRQTHDQPTVLWFLGDIRNLPHLMLEGGSAVLPAELAFDPDGNFHDDPRNGPKYDRPDYHFQGFPYLLERLRLGEWYSHLNAEKPVWDVNATALSPLPSATWDSFGFIGLAGVPIAPYFGPIAIETGDSGDSMIMAAWNPAITGFAAQPSVSKEWVKLARINITFDYDNLVHVYDATREIGLFVGFKDYRFVPDRYLEIPSVPQPILDLGDLPDPEEQLRRLQVIQLDTGTIIAPQETGVYLGLSSGVAVLRALAQAQNLGMPESSVLQQWAQGLNINATAMSVYIQQLEIVWNEHGAFDYAETTTILDQLSDADVENLLDQDQVGGRTQGLLAERGINIRRLRGVVEVEGEGLQTQFKRFHLSTQVEIQGRDQDSENVLPLPSNPAEQEDPPLFYAERMTLSIERHGDFMLVGKDVQSSKFKEKLDSFDATLVINATKPQFEGGVTLYGFKAGGATIDNGSAVVGIGRDMNYLGVSFDGKMGMGESEILIGGDLLAGVVDTSSAVLQNNFADAMAQIEDDIQGQDGAEDLTNMAGFYLRAYGGKIPIVDMQCLLNLKADVEIAFWYWKLAENGENFGGLLNPAVYGDVLCAVKARGDLRLYYQRVDGQDHFNGEGYIAGGAGNCDPSTWTEWSERWWNDSFCLQAGAWLNVNYGVGGWSVDYDADYERLFDN